ncbi:hypothetical protein CALCODRAFT_85936 [Calocera cornea HHB12733]|uniref:Uncharacterized protein n=1 Tax=Calocera cornea HHB12733 TaxID=1353952 RepID=A0A165IPF1_9BASI|nr:hypothetical protein CALCODRAFT_85936 [Calocera cornea HHB12733]
MEVAGWRRSATVRLGLCLARPASRAPCLAPLLTKCERRTDWGDSGTHPAGPPRRAARVRHGPLRGSSTRPELPASQVVPPPHAPPRPAPILSQACRIFPAF